MRVPVERLTPSLAYSSPPIVHDVRHRRQRLDVVHDGRLRVEARDRGERRPDARHARARLRATRAARSLHRRCTRPRRGARRCRRSKPEPRMFVAEEALRLRVGDGLREPFVAERELAADVDERDVALHRVRRDGDALDELVRIALEEHAVLERRRLAFVGVDHEVAREQSRAAGTTTSARSGSRRRRGRAGPTASPAPARRPRSPLASTARSDS